MYRNLPPRHCGSRYNLHAPIPLAGAAGLPFGLALATASRPLVGGLGPGLAVGGQHYMGASCGWLPLLLTTFVVKT
ncbi:hypothetical protein GW17_00042875 [Ensete ventricosum]|nr:hypothetical protein GW17_00042875 [Ensete ventricosum]